MADSPSGNEEDIWYASLFRVKPSTSAKIWAPRARACSSDSRMRAPPPSAMTKPERVESKGRQARVESLISLDIDLIVSNAPKVSEASGASAAPAIMTLARPSRMMRKASPTATVPEAQLLELVVL